MPGLLDLLGQGAGAASGVLGGAGNFFDSLTPQGRQMQIQRQIMQQQLQSLSQMPQFQQPGGQAQMLEALQSPEMYSKIIGGDISTDPNGVMRRVPLGGPPQVIGQQQPPYTKVGMGEGIWTPPTGLPQMGGSQAGAPQTQAGTPQAQAGAPPAPAPGTQGGMVYQNTTGQMPPAAIQNLVERRLKGDTRVDAELSSGGMGAGGAAIQNKTAYQTLLAQTMKDRGISPGDLVARTAKFPAYEDALKTNAQVGTRMQTAQTEALGILPQLKAAAAATNPSDFPIWNQAKLAYMAHTGDPRSASLASYANAMINTYARGITTNPRGPTDSDKQHLRDVVDPYWSRGQWEAGAAAIQNELDIAHQAIGKSRNQIDVNYGFGHEPDPADVAGAQAAIARGAPKEQIIRRFEESGFNAPKF